VSLSVVVVLVVAVLWLRTNVHVGVLTLVMIVYSASRLGISALAASRRSKEAPRGGV
jgi:hypothetical protein